MLWGDQWICKCGWHNFVLRKKCRHCDGEKEKFSVGEEDRQTVIDNTIKEQSEDLEIIPDSEFIKV